MDRCHKDIAESIATTSTKYAPTPDRQDMEFEASIVTVTHACGNAKVAYSADGDKRHVLQLGTDSRYRQAYGTTAYP